MVGVPGRSNGCQTCRIRKKGCDREQPSCGQCRRAGFKCDGYQRNQLVFRNSTLDTHNRIVKVLSPTLAFSEPALPIQHRSSLKSPRHTYSKRVLLQQEKDEKERWSKIQLQRSLGSGGSWRLGTASENESILLYICDVSTNVMGILLSGPRNLLIQAIIFHLHGAAFRDWAVVKAEIARATIDGGTKSSVAILRATQRAYRGLVAEISRHRHLTGPVVSAVGIAIFTDGTAGMMVHRDAYERMLQINGGLEAVCRLFPQPEYLVGHILIALQSAWTPQSISTWHVDLQKALGSASALLSAGRRSEWMSLFLSPTVRCWLDLPPLSLILKQSPPNDYRQLVEHYIVRHLLVLALWERRADARQTEDFLRSVAWHLHACTIYDGNGQSQLTPLGLLVILLQIGIENHVHNAGVEAQELQTLQILLIVRLLRLFAVLSAASRLIFFRFLDDSLRGVNSSTIDINFLWQDLAQKEAHDLG